MKRLFMIFKDNSYMEYAKYIQAKGIDVHTFNSFEEAIEKIRACNPGAIVSINYKCNTLEDFLIKIREVTGCKIYILSGAKPPAKLIQKADELKNIAVKWGKEIDIDIENIPETEEKVYQDKEPVEELPDPEADEVALYEEPDEECEEQTDEPEEVETELPEIIENDFTEEIAQPGEPEAFSETNSGIKLIVLMEKSLEEDLKKCSSMFNIKTAEHMEEVLQEIEKDAAAAVIFSGSICEKNFEDVKRAAKSIPKIVKLYAIDNVKLNQLIYGELETNGIKFFPDFQGIIDDIEDPGDLPDPEADEEGTDIKSSDKPGQNIIKNVSGAVSEIIKTTKSIPKPVINFPNIKVPKLKAEKKEDKKVKSNKQVHTFVERSKVMLFLSPLTTGKTEIASNVAQGLSLKGVKTALIDLDLDKKGLFYSFPIFEKGDIYKYRLLSLSLSEQKLVDEPLELSFKANKNLFVYTTHRDIEIPFTPRILDLFIRYLKRTVDVIVVDVGKSLSKDLIESLLDIESIDKYLVANQDIGALNTIPYSLNWLGSFPAYYKDWNLVLNNYRPLKGLKDSEILSYFYDEESTDLKFDILKTFHIPQSDSVWEKKTERALSYGSDGSFDAAVDKIIESWMIGKAQKGGVTIEI